MSQPSTTTKGTKIKRALKSAARLPPSIRAGRIPYTSIHAGRGSGRNNFSPRPGEPPVVIFRIQVLGCMGLLAKDRAGTSDPFVVVSLLNTRQQTPVAKRTLNPIYAPNVATFDFPIYLSLADKLGAVELVVWDKDMLKKDYLGEVALPLDEWFSDRAGGEKSFGFAEKGNKAFSLDILSTRAGTPGTGSIQVKLGFVPTSNANNLMEYDEIYTELIKRSRSRPSVVSAPPTEGVGTIRSNHYGAAQYQDDGGLSSDSDDSDDDAEDHETTDSPSTRQDFTKPLLDLYIPPPLDDAWTLPPPISTDSAPLELARSSSVHASSSSPTSSSQPNPPPFKVAPAPPSLNILPSSPATPTAGSNIPTPTPFGDDTPRQSAGFSVPTPHSSRFTPKKFVRKISGLTSHSNTPTTPSIQSPAPLASPAVDLQGNLVPPQKETRQANGGRRRFNTRSWSTGSVSASSGSESGTPNGGPATPSGQSGGAMAGLTAAMRRKSDFEFKGANDIVGIVMLEIQGADDLPRLANMTRTGWDMDPFVVISFGKKVFRTRVIRHSRNPVWDEKLLFHVRRYETSYKVQLTVLDWDKLSSNDHIGDVNFDVKDLVDSAPQPDPQTGLYMDMGSVGTNTEGEGEKGVRDYSLPLRTAKEMPWEAKHNPVIRFRAKYQPYDALRQRFWRQYLKQYDTDDTGALSHLEITSMLDSLGSTLTRSTISSFFTRYGKRSHEDEITIDQAVQCLETELGRPDSEKKRVDVDDNMPDTSVTATPVVMIAGEHGEEVKLDLAQLDFSGPSHVAGMGGGIEDGSDRAVKEGVPVPPGPYATESMQVPLAEALTDCSSDDADADLSNPSTPMTTPLVPSAIPGEEKKSKKMRFKRLKKHTASSPKQPSDDPTTPIESNAIERVINVKNCPLCHRPRLNSKAEMDIVTHLAICASQDWAKVDRIVVGNFVTASQAQRKWYTKIISKVSSGDYRLGANSANIIVQNRMTGQLEEEKMQVYVRLGIRLLYKGATSRMEGGRARRLLKSLSIKQGVKYDDPESAKEIPTFINFHGLKVDEIRDPLDSFKTFNQFFYRKLKPSARPIEAQDNPYRLVSAADCRLMTFETVSEATRLWIKGREFTVARLLGDAYKGQAEKYTGGAVAIFRLAPQDYHRFHSPVEGTIGPMTYIAGEYYTVNPQAIRTALDVYGENARKIVPIDSPQFGRVMAVCIGAMMVGSIITTVQEGEHVNKGQEFGYFAFGGSTIVILFEKGKVVWDEDLLINGRASLETLVRVGMGIGNHK